MELEQFVYTLPQPVASDLVGMGTWRLKGNVDPAIQFLVARIEGSWRELMKEGGHRS
jgi:hypothetical protein